MTHAVGYGISKNGYGLLFRVEEFRRMKIQLFHAVICLCAALAAQSASADDVKNPQTIADQPSDPICKVVMDALLSIKASGYHETVFGRAKDGKDEEYVQIIHADGRDFARYYDTLNWLRFPHEPNKTRFLECEPVGNPSEFHYVAIWQKYPHGTRAEIWLTPDGKKLQKLIRHFGDDQMLFPFQYDQLSVPFQTATSVFDYDAGSTEVPPEILIINDSTIEDDALGPHWVIPDHDVSNRPE